MRTFLAVLFCSGLAYAQDPFEAQIQKDKAAQQRQREHDLKMERSAAPTKEMATKLSFRDWKTADGKTLSARLSRVFLNAQYDVESVEVLDKDGKRQELAYSLVGLDNRTYVSAFMKWSKEQPKEKTESFAPETREQPDGPDESDDSFTDVIKPHEHWTIKVAHPYSYTKREQTGWDHHHPVYAPNGNIMGYPPVYGDVGHTSTKYANETINAQFVSYEAGEVTLKEGNNQPRTFRASAFMSESDKKWLSVVAKVKHKTQWKSSTGKTMDATLTAFSASKVKLQRDGSDVKEVSISALSDEDQKFVRDIKDALRKG